jgi:hypothetical protein
MVLASGTWPTWAAYGRVLISNVSYAVASRDSDSQITLSVNFTPGANIAAGTAYQIYQDTYPLPVDVKCIGQLVDLSTSRWLDYTTPENWLESQRSFQTPTVPRYYTIQQDPKYIGTMGVSFAPPPSTAMNYDYAYLRYPRQILTPQYNTGTVTTSGTTVTGTGTAWTSSMVGCVFRFGDTTHAVTGIAGEYPFVAQRIVTAFGSATSLTIDVALSAELTTVTYEIADPIDIDSGPMYTAFLRKCEAELALLMSREDAPFRQSVYQSAVRTAMEADSRSKADKPSNGGQWIQLRNMPFSLNT